MLCTQINLTIADANGATICLQTKAACQTPAQLCEPGDGSCIYSIVKSGKCDCCPVGPKKSPPAPPNAPPPHEPQTPNDNPPQPPAPPPPSPPKPSPFPFCKCNKTAGITPFSLSPNTVVSQGKDGLIYTWTVESADPIDPSSPCAATTLYKAEFWSNANCYRAVRRAYINGKAVSPSWDPVNSIWKVTNIKFGASDPEPGAVGTIGFELSSSGPCPTLEALCHNGNCIYSLFDVSKTCCPGGTVDVV